MLSQLPCVYHLTDMSNLVGIAQRGEVLSRTELQARGIGYHSSAQDSVLNRRTHKTVMDGMRTYNVSLNDYVPLYFRTRTPMQFHTEGVKVEQDGWRHMPRPVILAFPTADVLHNDTLVADGNAAQRGTNLVQGPAGLHWLDPALIFHEGSDGFNQDIKRARQSELLVPGRLPLDKAKALYFRSEGDRRAAEELLWQDSVDTDALPRFVVEPTHFFPDRRRLLNYGFTHIDLRTDAEVVHVINHTTRLHTYLAKEPLWYGIHIYRPDISYQEQVTVEVCTEAGILVYRRTHTPQESTADWVVYGTFELPESAYATCWMEDHEMFSEYLEVE